MEVLLIGCPPTWPAHVAAAAVSEPEWPPVRMPTTTPLAAIIGPGVLRPIAVARSVTRELGRIVIVVTAPPANVEALRTMLTITPLVSPHTRVIAVENPERPPAEIAAILSDARRFARHNRELEVVERQRISGASSRHTASVDETDTRSDPSAREQLYALIAESTDDAVFSMTLDGKVTGWNPGAERLYGRRESEMLGSSFERMVDESALAEHRDIMGRLGTGESGRELRTRHRTATGNIALIALTLSPIRDGKGTIVGVSAIARDITRTAELEARHAAIVASAFDAILTMDARGNVVEFNPAAQAMFGYSLEEALGKPLAELIVPLRLRDEHQAGLERLLSGAPSRVLGRRVEAPAMRRDGTEFPAELFVARLDGTASVLFTVYLRDLTELRSAQDDLQRTIQTLERSNRDLEQFAYLASHDLQEPLRMVSSFMRLLEANYAEQLDSTASEYIAFATDGAARMKRLIDGLLVYSRVDSRGQRFTPTSAQQVMQETVDSLRLVIADERAEILALDLPMVLADPNQLGQVFQNLISNAVKFRRSERPRIEIDARPAGDFWEFCVCDNGIGFEPEHSERIFSMFQRLHARGEYEGSGIGLSISKRIVERHGGTMWATSVLGRGSRVFFTLPRADQPTSEAR